MIAAIVLCGAAMWLFSSCRKPDLTPREGFIDVPGGKVWYRIAGTGTRTPLLLLHGGPGAPSYYLKPLAALGDDRPVIFYDQLGCGHSDHPTDSTLWTIDRFVQELVAVREALGLNEVHILGTSWGTMLAVDYVLKKPGGVRSLVLASPALSIPRWVHDADSLKSTLPESTRSAIARHEADGTYDSPEYQSAMLEYYHRFVCRRNPWPADVESTFAQLGQSVYMAMCGPSEFTITGSLKSYDRTGRLHEITVPTLFTAGRYDEAAPSTVQYYSSLMPGSRVEIFENSAHVTMEDEPERYVQVVRDFLREVDSK
jgi:proline iminopeptidase